MPIQNLWLPFGIAVAVGAIIVGMFYRQRNQDYQYGDDGPPFDGSDFKPDAGYDTRTQKSKKKDEEDEKCIICYESMRGYQCVRALPCAHKFHRTCVNSWLRFEQFCPLCRTVVT